MINFIVSIPLSLWIPFYSFTGVFIYLAIKEFKSSFHTRKNGVIPPMYRGELTFKEELSIAMKIETINLSAKVLVVFFTVLHDF